MTDNEPKDVEEGQHQEQPTVAENEKGEHLLKPFWGGVILLTFVLTAIISLSELTSRTVEQKDLQSKIAKIESEIATLAINILPTNFGEQSIAAVQPTAEGSNDILSRQREDNARLETQASQFFENIRIFIRKDEKLRELQDKLETIERKSRHGVDFQLYSEFSSDKNPLSIFGYIIIGLQKMSASTEMLLAITVMCCTATGAMIAGFRGGSHVTSRSILIGVASGFVVYLGVKGGRFLFLLETGQNTILINPFGTAFVGVLVGLFSDMAYGAIKDVFESLVKAARKLRIEPR